MWQVIGAAWVATALVLGACGDTGNAPSDAYVGTDVTCSATLAAIPDSLTFTPLVQGTTSPVAGIAITHVGTCASAPLALSLVGAAAADFAIESSTCAGHTLAPAQSCSIQIRFTPQSTGTRTAAVRVDGADAPLLVMLAGDGLAGPSTIGVSPAMIAFGSSAAPGTRRSVTVTNPGASPSGALSTTLGGTNPSSYVLVNNTCSGAVLAPGASCTLAVETTCTGVTQPQSAVLSIVATPGGSASVPITGTVLGKPCSVFLVGTPSLATFGDQPVGTSSTATRFSISNAGAQPSGVLAPMVTGASATDFSITAATCTGVVLAPGDTCTIDVAFAPLSSGMKSAILAVSPNLSLALAGTGLDQLTISPASQDFGTVLAFNPSAPKTFTVTNIGASTLSSLAVTLGGANAGEFSRTHDCTGTLAPGGTCTVSVVAMTTTIGAKAATVTVSSSGGMATAAVVANSLNPPALSITPSSKSFGTLALGSTSSAEQFTVTNTAGASTGTLGVTKAGPNAADFAIAASTCQGAILPPGGSCTVDVTFTPTAAGMRGATITVSGVPGGTVGAAVEGIGQ